MNYSQSLLALSLSLISVFANSVGFRLPNQDPEGIARGNAFVATADNPSAVYHNAAGITQLEEGSHMSIGGYFISANVDYTSVSGDITGETDESIQAVPQIHYVHNIKDSNFSLGLGLYAPYGLGVDWQDSPFPTIAEEGSLTYLTLNPVVAYKVANNLSLAVGLTLNWSEVDLTQEIGFIAEDEFNIKGNGNDIGYTLGALWEINQNWSFGLNYRSETQIDYEGRSIATSSPFASEYVRTTSSLVFPQYVDLGFAYKPVEDWTFEVNIDWTDWNSVDESVFVGTGLGDLVFPLNYESSLMYEFGITKELDSGLLLSTGYIFSEESSPDESFTPFNPEGDFHLGSIGIASRSGKIGWSIGYHFAYNSGREVRGNQRTSFIGDTADGTYKVFNQAINVAIRFSF